MGVDFLKIEKNWAISMPKNKSLIKKPVKGGESDVQIAFLLVMRHYPNIMRIF